MHWVMVALLILTALALFVPPLMRRYRKDSTASAPPAVGEAGRTLTLAYLADGKIFYKRAGGRIEQLHSPFAREAASRMERARERHSWKEGTAFNVAAHGGMRQFAPDLIPISATSATFDGDHRLLYFLSDHHVGGLFSYDLTTGTELRLIHRQRLHLSDLALEPGGGRIACCARTADGLGHIAMLDRDGGQYRELTGGDTYDSAPAWVPGEPDRIVFQSAGLARHTDGFVAAQGNASLQMLDLRTGSLTTLLEDESHDLLAPRVAPDGSLYFIRRPYSLPKYGPEQALLDFLLFPFRLLRAVFHYLNFFSLMYTRKPLTSAGGPSRQADMREILLKGKRIDAEKALRREARVNGIPSLVPRSWQLVRRTPEGRESVLATNVLSFDLTPDGGILYSNGRGVFLLTAEGPALVLRTDLVSEVMAAGEDHGPREPVESTQETAAAPT